MSFSPFFQPVSAAWTGCWIHGQGSRNAAGPIAAPTRGAARYPALFKPGWLGYVPAAPSELGDDSLETLLSPVILFFLLGALAAFARSDLAIPDSIAKGMSLYLMASIGLRGGSEVAASGLGADMLAAGLAGVGLSLLLPVPAFWLLRRIGRLSPTDAAAVAAHYGSVSVVTFVTGVEVLTQNGMPPAGYMVAVLAMMEAPGVISGLLLARRAGAIGRGAAHDGQPGVWREALLNGSVVLLVGSFAIGFVAPRSGLETVLPFFNDIFRGVLCLFLLDMGLLAARRFRDARALTLPIAALAIVLPLVNGSIGVLTGTLIGLDPGSAAALGILAGSASYIAAPAVIRMALPQADPGLYLGMSLAVTFPFNILFGISAYTFLAQGIAVS